MNNFSQLIFNRSDSVHYDGTISGTGSLDKAGFGMLTLSGDSGAFGGHATVYNGILAVNGMLGGTLHVLPHASLYGTGHIGATTVEGNVAPGDSIGTLTVHGNYVQLHGPTYEVEIDPDGASDQVIVTDLADIQGGTISVIPAGDSLGRLGGSNPIYKAIVHQPDQESVRQAFNSLSGEGHASIQGVIIEDSRFIREAVSDRVRQAFQLGVRSHLILRDISFNRAPVPMVHCGAVSWVRSATGMEALMPLVLGARLLEFLWAGICGSPINFFSASQEGIRRDPMRERAFLPPRVTVTMFRFMAAGSRDLLACVLAPRISGTIWRRGGT